MSKRIIYCADGTWQSSVNKTNVYMISKAAVHSADQVVFYDDGVGADANAISRALGGAFGTGLFNKIKQGYGQIAGIYQPGDELYIFGFSRGAYTARSLAGMIAICGLPTKDFTDQVVDTAFNAYRDRDDRQNLLDSLKDHAIFDAQIQMVGVWETVGGLGIPSAIGISDPILYGFLDTALHPDVHNAYHAVAIDEKRVEFPATLWTSPPAPGQVVEQVWFTGCHGDVGGGTSDERDGTALSDIALGWMMSKASALGVRFDATVVANNPFPLESKFALDTLHESWNVLWGFYKHREISQASIVASSVAVRCQHFLSYQPSNLLVHNGVLASSYGSEVVVAV